MTHTHPDTPAATQPALRDRLTATAEGTHRDAFGASEWGLFAAVALLWGSSFMFIDLGLTTFAPSVVALARLALGATTLALFPRARRPVHRADLPRVALLGVVWMAVPLMLFPIAQQHVDSSAAGMVNAAAPLFTAVIAAVLLRRLPGSWQLAGLAIGFPAWWASACPTSAVRRPSTASACCWSPWPSTASRSTSLFPSSSAMAPCPCFYARS